MTKKDTPSPESEASRLGELGKKFSLEGLEKVLSKSGRTLFRKFGLDPKDPRSWRELPFFYLAGECFPEGRKMGRPKTDDLQIIEDFAATRRRYPGYSDEKIFEVMAELGACGGRYAHVTPDAIRKRWNRAVNPAVAKALQRTLPKLRAQAQAKGKPFSEAKARKDIRRAVIEGALEGVLRHRARAPK